MAGRLAVAFVAAFTAACGGGGSSPDRGPDTPSGAHAHPSPAASATVLRSTVFAGANGYTTMGQAAIVREGTGHRLELREDFRTSQSAALDVRLCRETRCTGDDLNLGEIKAFAGAQQYALPDDAGAYRYAVIWCRAVSLPFGFGELR